MRDYCLLLPSCLHKMGNLSCFAHDLLAITACHSCPLSHFHQTFLLLIREIFDGENAPFLRRCQDLISSSERLLPFPFGDSLFIFERKQGRPSRMAGHP